MTRRPARASRRGNRAGTALLAALATVALLATLTAMTAQGARTSAAVVHNARADAVARGMAESGVLAAVDRLEGALSAARDSAQRLAVFDALLDAPRSTGATAPFVHDTLDSGVFSVALVNVSARFDVNSGDEEGLARLFGTVAPRADAVAAAARVVARLRQRPLSRTASDAARDSMRAVRDSISAALLGRDRPTDPLGRFDSLDELADWLGADAPWLGRIAESLTVDGDGMIDRRHAPPAVLRAASGSLVDQPTRVLIVSRGWERGSLLTREIQAVYAVSDNQLSLVRWREQRR